MWNPEADVNLIGEDSLDEDSNRTLHSIMKTFKSYMEGGA